MSGLITAFCPTLNRPELLGRAIKMFELQTYPNKHLIIVDDIGQYHPQRGDNWTLVSISQRVRSLGEKNNMCISLAPRETAYFAKFDDDDVYNPWHLEAMVEALQRGHWVQPRLAIDLHTDYYGDRRWALTETFNRKYPDNFAYHGQWAYSAAMIDQLGGYRHTFAGDDGELQKRAHGWGMSSVDIDRNKYKTSYRYSRHLPGRISERGGSEQAYWDSAPADPKWVGVVPKYEGEEVWNLPIPTEVCQRPW